MRDPIAGMLDHQTFLRLTPAQVNNLISIDDKLHDDNKPLVSRLMTMRSGVRRDMAGRGAGRDSASSDARTGQRDSAEAIVRTIRHNVWRATSAADAVLTPEQLNSAAMLDRSAHRSERSHPGMGPGSRRGPGTDRGR